MKLNTIHLGDIIEVLNTFDDNIVDIIVTSPPYNKMNVKGGLVNEVKYNNSIDNMPELDYQTNQIKVLDELYRVTKSGGHIFYNHKLRWIDGNMIHPLQWISKSKWNIRQEIVWDRQISGQLRGWRFWQTEERIYWMQKGITKGEELLSKHAKMTSIWRIRPENKYKDHPAPFPIELPTRCIYSVADVKTGLTVLDPYCGTGTTLSAAKCLNHNYIGIDCSKEYIQIAEGRLNDKTGNDYNDVIHEVSLHTVKETYKEKKLKKLKKD